MLPGIISELIHIDDGAATEVKFAREDKVNRAEARP
jgi:hypothetical protein